MQRITSRFSWLQTHRQRVIVIGSVLLGLLTIGGYALWSHQVWSEYQPSYRQWQQAIQADVDKAVALPTTSAKDREAVLRAFSKVNQRISDTQSTVCQLPVLVNWQIVLAESIQEAQADCMQSVAAVTTFNAQLQDVTRYLQNDQVLSTIIAAVPQPNELSNDMWQQQADEWQQAVEATEMMSVIKEFEPIKQRAVKQMNVIKEAWQALMAADVAKEKKAYMEAQVQLATSYDGMNEIATISEKVITDMTVQLQQRYDAISK